MCYPAIQYGSNTLSNLHSFICQVVACGRLKTKENFKRLALKWLWSLTRGGRLQEVSNKQQ